MRGATRKFLRRLTQPKESKWFRFIFGRRLKTTEWGSQQVSPLHGVPILGLDAIGSSSYGPEAALAVMAAAGAAGLQAMGHIIAIIVLLLAILFFSYRQTIAAYPGGGGSYTVARENLGEAAGLLAAAALAMDYILNVAVGISAGVGAAESALPQLHEHTLGLCLAVLVIITLVNLRGVRDSGVAWSFPTYAYVGCMIAVLVIGLSRTMASHGAVTPMTPPPALGVQAAPLGFWLILKAFASGCTAMTGVEAVSNGVPIFAEPRVKNARRTLALISGVLALLLMGIAYLVQTYSIGAMDQSQAGYQSVVSQLVGAVAGQGWLYDITMGSLLAVLVLSANTSFADFPRLSHLLARDGYLPSVFGILGRRLVYSWGIVFLALSSAGLLIAFNGITDRLIPLFAVGAFGAFTASQAGMVAHWWRVKQKQISPSLVINALGALSTAAAIVVIILAKFTQGAWISVLVIFALFLIFSKVGRHYRNLYDAMQAPAKLLATQVREMKVVVPMESWNAVTERALRFALRISPDVTALHISADGDKSALIERWQRDVVIPAQEAGYASPELVAIYSPYRLYFHPLLEYLDEVKETSPEHLLAIVVPELVEPRWWEYLMHNYLTATLKAMLLLRGNERVVVISTPWRARERT